MSPWKFTCVLVHVYTCLTFGDDVIDVLGNMVLDLSEFLRTDRSCYNIQCGYHMYVFTCGTPH